MKIPVAGKLILGTINEWIEDGVSRFAASLAFYTLFSLVAILVILLAIVGGFYGPEAARVGIFESSERLVGPLAAQVVMTALDDADASSKTLTVLGIAGLLFGSTAVFVNLQDALNSIWGVAVSPGWQVWPFFRKRIVSFFLLIGFGLILILSFAISTAIAAFREYATGVSPFAARPLAVADFIMWLVILTLAFGAIYKVLPDARISWPDVWLGAAAAALLFTIGRTLIGMYLARSTVASGWGAAGSLVIFQLWIYYSAQIFLLCSEFTYVYAKHRGQRVVPDENAVRILKTQVPLA